MAKIILWIVIVFVVLFALRMLNAGKAQRRRDEARSARRTQDMIRCVHCGVYVPRADAKPSPAGLTCGDPVCLSR
jgi:uncharacterized protein